MKQHTSAVAAKTNKDIAAFIFSSTTFCTVTKIVFQQSSYFTCVPSVRIHLLSASFPTLHFSVACFILSPLSVCSVSHCTSTACLMMSLCTFSDAEDWFCECPPLYTGRLCQLSACERNPCSHGATCIPKSPLEAVCLCPYGRQGLLCDQRK